MLSNTLVRRGTSPAVFSDLVDRFFDNGNVWTEARRAWTPAVDIHEESEAFVLTADLPGLGKGDVDITLENNVLTLSGERTFEEKAEGESYRRRERAYGKFVRRFSLPDHVDPAKVEASFEDGVLRIHVPKSQAAKSRKIEIS